MLNRPSDPCRFTLLFHGDRGPGPWNGSADLHPARCPNCSARRGGAGQNLAAGLPGFRAIFPETGASPGEGVCHGRQTGATEGITRRVIHSLDREAGPRSVDCKNSRILMVPENARLHIAEDIDCLAVSVRASRTQTVKNHENRPVRHLRAGMVIHGVRRLLQDRYISLDDPAWLRNSHGCGSRGDRRPTR